jgi:O-antigen chain-terminating methyltransferase
MVAGFDYESFEGRFRPEEHVRVHQRGYLDVLGDRTRVVDVGCGRGELVEILGERGVAAYGLELDADFVALAAERGVDVRHGDGIAHLEGLTPGEVDAVVASHVVEHLEPRDVLRLVDAAAAALPEGGVLVLETPNAESLVAGSVNFHRDLSHRRPIHPDTLAFVCESAGFGEVEVRRLSPVPDAELLPMPPEGAPGAEALSPVVERLNALIYGFQDYAVVARR